VGAEAGLFRRREVSRNQNAARHHAESGVLEAIV
jgi:hypothetical protein